MWLEHKFCFVAKRQVSFNYFYGKFMTVKCKVFIFLMGFGKFCKSKNAGKEASKQVSKQASKQASNLICQCRLGIWAAI